MLGVRCIRCHMEMAESEVEVAEVRFQRLSDDEAAKLWSKRHFVLGSRIALARPRGAEYIAGICAACIDQEVGR